MMKEKQRKPFPLAVCCGDLHLSARPPVARSVEPDWLEVQKDYLQQLDRIAGEHHCPILCAGDVFDTWHQPPEIVNLCLRYAPFMYGVCGQHDLRHHDYGQLRRTSFWTLVEAKKFCLLEPGKPVDIGVGTPIRLHGFPWGFPLKPPKETFDLAVDVAVVHAYVWTKKTGYPGAPPESRLKRFAEQLVGYDAVLFGDNHTPFDAKIGDCTVFNGGSFLRRKQDERAHKPSVGVLYNDGTIERVYLDTSKDRFLEPEQLAKVVAGGDFEEMLDALRSFGDGALNFADAIRQALKQGKVAPEVERLVLSALEG